MSLNMVPLLELTPISNAQARDIEQRLRDSKIPFHIVKVPTRIHQFAITASCLFVADDDLSKAQDVLRDEYKAFALNQREKWEREWRDKYKGSYWKWLCHRQAGNAKLTLLKWFYLIS